MPYGSGRTGTPGNTVGKMATGRTGSAGNGEAMHKARQPGSMKQTGTIAGRSLTPGNDTSLRLPSNAAGSMGSKTGKPDSSGVPSRSSGKFNYASSKGLLKR